MIGAALEVNIRNAKKLALENEARRKRVLVLSGRAMRKGQASPYQKAELAKLEKKIRNCEAEIVRLGADPQRVGEWAKAELLRTKAPSGLAPKRYRGSGTGTYALGASTKQWR